MDGTPQSPDQWESLRLYAAINSPNSLGQKLMQPLQLMPWRMCPVIRFKGGPVKCAELCFVFCPGSVINKTQVSSNSVTIKLKQH